MRYLLIDRIVRLEVGKQLVAIKNISLSEDVFTYHFVGSPVMPGALLIESMAQAATALLELSSDIRRKALLVMVESAKFRSLVRPGDQLQITVTVASRDADLVRTNASIKLRDIAVADALLVFAMTDAEEFYPGRIRDWVDVMYEGWLRGAEVIRSPDTPKEPA
jgi:3-hydroxyacyl-[acyl-carrier-protein] dehydratase